MTTGTPTVADTLGDAAPDAWSLSPAQAGERLEAMSKDYQTAAEAKADARRTPGQKAAAALERKMQDPEWRRRLENGGVAERDEWQALLTAQNEGQGASTLEDIARGRAIAPANEVTFDGAISTRDLMTTAADLKEIGIPEGGVAAILRGDTFSEADVQGARAWLAEAGRNPAFLKALMEGEPTVVHQFTARNAIIAGGVKEE
jgi:hypothetical protein